MKYLLLISVMFLSGCAFVEKNSGSIADSTTTYVAISNDLAVEANPLYGNLSGAQVAILSLILKQSLKYIGDSCNVDRYIETASWAAAVWNIGVMASVATPVGVVSGIGAGIIYYKSNEC